MVPGVMMFLSLPFPTLIMAFLVGHIAFRTIDAILRWFMYTNDPSCYGTVIASGLIRNNLLLCAASSQCRCADQNNRIGGLCLDNALLPLQEALFPTARLPEIMRTTCKHVKRLALPKPV